ncbi:hypothetical protein BDK51DRAFT_29209 [Blyttiomyces helicus]|uniref:Nascent polypeptide-associated complex subunit alpha-like UBA domain-containing protein n=1 Tax=Blyttiomyces helicus TaxID=388810 RepID=A0A4P9WBY7_9FUNG|nr:hypothetical protein BDK51DRAFT_29209 [Blyttiomyces helicus]|eukprot:RKO89093.1 hypothetical protein BDK51DRAFT_29209 [Blyttiomyces helicus]
MTKDQTPTNSNPDVTEDIPEDDADAAAQKGYKGQAKKDMESVTGYFEEAKDNVDESKLDQAMNYLEDVSNKAKAQRTAHPPLMLRTPRITSDKELDKIVISKDDVDLIMRELEIAKAPAERALREHNGSVVDALAFLVRK